MAAGKRCEDSAGVFERETDGVRLAVVADGAGGVSGGAAASALIVAAVGAAAHGGADLLDPMLWKHLLIESALRLRNESIGETTAVIIATDGKTVVGASVGDSAAWKIRRDGYSELTRGQPRKPLLGAGWVDPFLIHAELRPGDALLLGTDGLFKYAAADRICETVIESLTSEECCASLARLPRLPNGRLQDDVGVALIRN